MMLFGNATFAFAKELPNVTVNDTETTNEVVPASVGEGAAAYIAPRGTLVLHPTLNSYVGFTRTFWFWASANDSDTTPSGKLRVYVDKPDGSLLEYFEVNPNQDFIKTYTLPPSGRYTETVYSEVQARLYVNTTWSTVSS